MPATFGDVYGRLCERWTDPRERGRQFEPLVERVLRTDRIFRERYAAVWHWRKSMSAWSDGMKPGVRT